MAHNKKSMCDNYHIIILDDVKNIATVSDRAQGGIKSKMYANM